MRSVITSKCRSSLILVITLCAVVPGCQQPQEENQENAPRTVYALGHLRPASGVIDIRATPGDRIKKLADAVELNSMIPSDGILGTLDSYDMGLAQLLALEQKKLLASQKYEHQKQLAVAQLAQANASKAQALAKQKEVVLQKEKLAVLERAMHLENDEYKKMEQLRAEDSELVTLHQLAKQKNKLDLATQDFQIANKSYQLTMDAADLAVEAAIQSWNVADLTHTQVSKKFSEQLETQLIEQEIKVAKEALKRSVLLAPNYSQPALDKRLSTPKTDSLEQTPDGTSTTDIVADTHSKGSSQYTVLKIYARDGEIVTQSPIMQLGDLNEMICVAEVYEADRKNLSRNQKVIIRSPAFSGYFEDGEIKNKEDKKSQERWGGLRGKIDKIGRMIAPPGLTSRNPLAPADRSVVEVIIKIDVEANRDEIKARQKIITKLDPSWGEDPNEHAAENVELQVTIEFCKEEEGSSSKPEQTNSDNVSKSEAQVTL